MKDCPKRKAVARMVFLYGLYPKLVAFKLGLGIKTVEDHFMKARRQIKSSTDSWMKGVDLR